MVGWGQSFFITSDSFSSFGVGELQLTGVRKVELTVVGVDWVGELELTRVRKLELTRVREVQLTRVGVDWGRRGSVDWRDGLGRACASHAGCHN